MRVFDASGTLLHWREDGDPEGVPVVFANSLGTDLRVWEDVVALLPKGLRVIRYDKRGHGLSDLGKTAPDMDLLATDIAGLLDHLQVTGAVFVGLSIGGMIGQQLAATRPDLVHALVLSNTAAKMGAPQMWEDRIAAVEAGGIEALAEPILERWFSAAFLKTDDLAPWRNMLLRTPRAGYTACCRAIAGADLAAQTATLTLPVLGIAGSEDLASPPELVAGTTALIPGSRFEQIEGVGHLPCVEAPETFAALLSDFIKETANE